MKIPKKISPDHIKQSVIAIRYASSIDFEIALGMFFNALDETYIYTNRPLNIKINERLTAVNFSDSGLMFNNSSLFFNDKIKIEIQKNSIIFNCLDEYISWINYAPEIKKALGQLLNAKVIDSFNGIGVRYISHYPNVDLKNCINFNFTFGMPNVISKSYSFKSEFDLSGDVAIINLHNKMPLFDNKFENNQPVTIPVSIVDIDIIGKNVAFRKDELDNFMEKISALHQKEKEIFFTLLKDDFLLTLNPIY